jgi:hypothetical protein
MLVPYSSTEASAYYGKYYADQAGGDMSVYAGRPVMNGKGIGGLLSSAFRAAMPLLKRAGKSLGKRALKTGAALAQDVVAGRNVKRAVKRRAIESGGDLLDDLAGITNNPPRAKRARRAKPRTVERKRKRGNNSDARRRFII